MTAVPGLRGVSGESLAQVRERLYERLGGDDADPATIAGELFGFVRLLDSAHALRRALSDPAYDGDRKAELALSLIGDQLGAVTREIVEALVRARWVRASHLPDATETLAVLAEVTSAEREGHLHDLEDELFRFRRIVDGQPQLRAVLSDPAVPAERKRPLVESLLGDKARPATLRLATEVASYPRGRAFDRGMQLYGQIAAQRRERLIASVRSAIPLEEEQRSRLADVLSSAYGQEIHLNVEIDPEVLGGLSVRIGDELIDGTIAGRLARTRRRMAG